MTGGPGTLPASAVAAPAAAPPAGQYGCWAWKSDAADAQGKRRPYQELGSVLLDGKGGYRLQGGTRTGQGGYAPDAAQKGYRFSGGPLTKYLPVFSEQLRLDAGTTVRVDTLNFRDAGANEDKAFWCELVSRPAAGSALTPMGRVLYGLHFQGGQPDQEHPDVQDSPATLVALDLKTARTSALFGASFSTGNVTQSISISAGPGNLWVYGKVGQQTVVLVRPSGQVFREIKRDDLDGDVRLSRDSRQVAFRSAKTVGDTLVSGMQVIDQRGHDVAYFRDFGSADWLPDGRLVAATLEKPETLKPGLYLLSPKGGKVTPLGSGLSLAAHPAVSPDGRRVAFSMGGHLWVIGTDGSGLKQLSSGKGTEDLPGWSPDGQALVAMRRSEDSLYGLVVYPLSGQPPIQLVDTEKHWLSSDVPLIWLNK
ncbi:TolB family protein [Deinococcus sp.]|uniref:TolB family protein n=1 Tax=Deinococcus sp. TaxID=47478 RepID=UPI003C7B879F